VQPGSVLDFRTFVTRIEPILAKPGPDGKACVNCHASHVIFKLEPPNAEGKFSDQDSENNYKYAMRVVDITEPDKSLMLIKPTRRLIAQETLGTIWPRTTAASAGMVTNQARSTVRFWTGFEVAERRRRAHQNEKTR